MQHLMLLDVVHATGRPSGADGAKVNMGVHRGVSALLKQAAGQHVIPIHYMPHR